MKTTAKLRSFLLASSALLAAPSLHAASGTWTGATDLTWAGANWSVTPPPGSTASTTSPDVATFGTTGTGTITVDANRNIGGINFNGNTNVFTLSSGNLLLTNGGTIQTSGAGGNHIDTINSPIKIEGDGGAASITAGSTNNSRIFVINGDITGVSTGSNVTTLTINGGNTNAFNNMVGVIGDGGGGGKLALVKSGGGYWILNNIANTYSGGTTISGGTLQIGNGGATGSYGSGTVANNGTLIWNNTSGLSVTSANAITGAGAFTVQAGTTFLRYDLVGSVSDGTITVDGTGSANSSSFTIWAPNPVTLANNFVLNSMGPAQNRGAINQDGGAGLVTLNGSITLAGDSRIGVGGGSWNSLVANGQITGAGKLFVYESHAANPSTELRLTNNTNNYAGGTEIEQGRLSITQAGALGTGPVTITGANSQLLIDEVSGTIANNFTLGGGGNPTSTNYAYGNATMLFHNDGQSATLSGTVTLAGDAKIRHYSGGGTTTFSNPIVGTGNLTFEAAGATSGHTQTWVLQGGASTFSGTTLVRSEGSANAVLKADGGSLTGALTLESSSFVGGNIAMLDLNGTNFSVGGLNSNIGGGSPGNFVSNLGVSPATLTINGGGVFNGVIGANTTTATTGIAAGSNNISLVKSGTGTQTLSGANTYTGATTISAGTLKLVGSNSPIAATSQSNYTPDGRLASHTIDGSGMTPNNPVTASSTSGNQPGNAMWLSDGTAQTWITFDLGSTRNVTGFHLWNYNEVNLTARGVETAGVYTGTSLLADGSSYASAGGAWGTLAQNFTFTQADGTAADAGADYTFGTPFTSRYLQIYVGSNFGGDAYTGLSEIQFYSNNGPLPTTTAVSIAANATLDLAGSYQQIASLTGESGASVINSLASSTSVLNVSSASGSTTFSGVIGGGGGVMSLVKDGNSTLTLTGANTYTGATTVSAGNLALVGGSQASPITLGSSGSLGFTLGSPTSSTSTFNLSVGSIAITGTPTLASYTLITSSTSITGTPTLSPAIAGYTLQNTGTSLKLVQVSGSPYSTWATAKGLTGAPGSSTDPAKNADPDGDGHNNLYEFAFDGNPLSGVSSGKVVSKIATIGADKVLTLTLPVRNGATFATDSGDLLSGLIDGIYYRIEAGTDLLNFADPIAEVTGADATAIQSGLPALSSGWTYRTFRVSGTVPSLPKDFMRAKVSDTP